MARLATTKDLAAIARVHKLAYSRTHFTAFLSEEVLARYYGAFLSGGTEIRLVFDEAGDDPEDLLGFAVYGVGIPDKIRKFKKACATGILLAAIRHPWLSIRKAMKAVWARLGPPESVSPADFLLLSIAVARPSRGIGGTLLDGMIAAARGYGQGKLGLYVNEDNVRAINAYCDVGFRFREFRSGQYYMERMLDV